MGEGGWADDAKENDWSNRMARHFAKKSEAPMHSPTKLFPESHRADQTGMSTDMSDRYLSFQGRWRITFLDVSSAGDALAI